MTGEEIAATFAEYGNRLRVSEHRISDLEEQQKQIQELTVSVKELAISVKNMVEEQKTQGERIRELEDKPGRNWDTVKKTVLTTIAGVIAGAVATGLLVMVAQYI